ncbi:hypothetical protein Bca101_082266 [Brassica carinata]
MFSRLVMIPSHNMNVISKNEKIKSQVLTLTEKLLPATNQNLKHRSEVDETMSFSTALVLLANDHYLTKKQSELSDPPSILSGNLELEDSVRNPISSQVKSNQPMILLISSQTAYYLIDPVFLVKTVLVK